MKKVRMIILTMLIIIPLLVTSCAQEVTEVPETEEPMVEEPENQALELDSA